MFGIQYDLIPSLGFIIIVVGIILIMIGMMSINGESESPRRESKGVVLLGPIPIIWGFGKRNRQIMLILVITVVLIFVLLFF